MTLADKIELTPKAVSGVLAGLVWSARVSWGRFDIEASPSPGSSVTVDRLVEGWAVVAVLERGRPGWASRLKLALRPLQISSPCNWPIASDGPSSPQSRWCFRTYGQGLWHCSQRVLSSMR